jgi:hypothetical protein
MNAKDVTVEALRETLLPGLLAYLEGVADATPEYTQIALAISDDAARWALGKWKGDPEADRCLLHVEAQGKLLQSLIEQREGRRLERDFAAIGRALAQVGLKILLSFVVAV